MQDIKKARLVGVLVDQGSCQQPERMNVPPHFTPFSLPFPPPLCVDQSFTIETIDISVFSAKCECSL